MKQGNTKLARLLLRIAGISNALLFFTLCCEATANGAAGVMGLMLLPLGLWVVALFYATNTGLWFEMGKDRVFRRVCIGIGFKGEAPSWKFGLIGRLRGDTKIITPLLRDVHGTHEAWIGTVTFFDGQTVEEYTKKADAFALAFHVPFMTFDLAENGLISVRAGKVPVPAAYDHPGRVQSSHAANNRPLPQQAATIHRVSGEELLRVAKTLDIAEVLGYQEQAPKVKNVYAHELELLKAVPMARDMNGRECKIPIEGQHWFVAGKTGSGKGSWIWSLILGLKPAWELGLVRFWGCNPKRLELAIIGPDFWEHYADTDESMVEMLEQAVNEMFAVGDMLKGKYRKFTPSRQTPLNVIVIDELGYVSSMLNDSKLQKRAHSAIKTLLTQGRSNGYAVIGAAIDVRKETVGFREEFPIRIAGSMSAPMVDLVLGEGMHDQGALCEQIPIGNAGAGVAYVVSETSLKPIYVRAAWISDDDIQGMPVRVPLRPVVDARGTQAVKDEPTGQLDWSGQPLGQFHNPVE